MAARVHGWRRYRVFTLPDSLQDAYLMGGTGVKLNSARPPAARCSGFTSFQDWVTDKVRAMSQIERHPPSGRAPQNNCTCGYYLLSHWPDESEWLAVPTIYAHVTCIGQTILHTEGARTAAYQVDYFIPPRVCQVPLGKTYLSHQYGPPEREMVDLVPLMARAFKKLQVPMIPFYGDGACQECIEANKEAKREPSWEEGKHGYPILGNVDDLPEVLGEPLSGTDLYSD